MPARVPGPTKYGSIFLSTPGPTGWRDLASPQPEIGPLHSEGTLKKFPFDAESLDDALDSDPSHLYQLTPLGYLANSVASNAQSVPNLSRYSIWTESGAVIFRVQTLAIDIDGAPDAYHPPIYPHFWHGKGPTLGRDYLMNAAANYALLNAGCAPGAPGLCVRKNPAAWQHARWVGVETDNGSENGNPRIQQTGRYRGYYVPRVMPPWANALEHPWVVLNRSLERQLHIHLGNSVAVVLNEDERAVGFGMLADPGPINRLGEVSNALLDDMELDETTNSGRDFIVVMFPGPQSTARRTGAQIRESAQAAFEKWGGLTAIKDFFPTRLEYGELLKDYEKTLQKQPGYVPRSSNQG